MATESSIYANDESIQRTSLPPSVNRFRYSNRVVLRSILDRDDGGQGLAGERVLIGGWVKSGVEKQKRDVPPPMAATPALVNDLTCAEFLLSRLPILRYFARIRTGGGHRIISFGKPSDSAELVPTLGYLRINDGSCAANFQVVIDSSLHPLSQILPIDTSILVEGVIARTKASGKYAVELIAEKVLYVGSVDAVKYPFSKGMLATTFLRTYPHFRLRTATAASAARISNSISHSTHQFFQSNGFLYMLTPIITTTTISSDIQGIISKTDDDVQEAEKLEAFKSAIKEKSKRIAEMKRSTSNREAIIIALKDLQKANELALQLEQKKASILTKSIKDLPSFAQLQLESSACSLSCVYSLRPTFQAEDLLSTKILVETWKVEVELAFAELADAMNCAEDFLRYLCHSIIKFCPHDIKHISKRVDNKCIDRIKSMESSSFARVAYSDALEILNKETNKKFGEKVEWGMSLSVEHEKFLVDEIYGRPIIIYDYPKDMKPFFMRIKDDDKTVSSFDIIVPKVGKLVQGSQKEERLDKLTDSIRKHGLNEEDYDWYLDLRRHGTVKHSGFSVGLEEIIMFITGLDNVRDAVPFPRDRVLC